MADSILQTIKRMIGPSLLSNEFDTDLVVHINSVLFDLNELGVGPEEGFMITGETETWQDFIGYDVKKLEAIKTFVYLKVKMLFDPPTIGGVIAAYEKLIKEYEWRINVMVDPGLTEKDRKEHRRPRKVNNLVIGEVVNIDRDRFKENRPCCQ